MPLAIVRTQSRDKFTSRVGIGVWRSTDIARVLNHPSSCAGGASAAPAISVERGRPRTRETRPEMDAIFPLSAKRPRSLVLADRLTDLINVNFKWREGIS